MAVHSSGVQDMGIRGPLEVMEQQYRSEGPRTGQAKFHGLDDLRRSTSVASRVSAREMTFESKGKAAAEGPWADGGFGPGEPVDGGPFLAPQDPA